MNLSKLYALPAERVDGKRRGYVLAAIKEGAGIAALLCADENEREFFIEPDKIVRTADAIVYQTEGKKRTRRGALRLNAPCYDECGNFLGYIEDYVLKQFEIKSCVINGKSYPAERVCLGDIAILKDKNGTAAAIAAKDMFLEAVMGANSRTLT